MLLKRWIPLFILISVGVLTLLSWFVPHWPIGDLGRCRGADSEEPSPGLIVSLFSVLVLSPNPVIILSYPTIRMEKTCGAQCFWPP